MDAPRQHEDPGDLHGECAGTPDTLDVSCNCPQLVLEIHMRVIDGRITKRRYYCSCCGLPISRSTA